MSDLEFSGNLFSIQLYDRPDVYDEKFAEEATKILAKDVYEWAILEYKEITFDCIFNALKKHISYNQDGYVLAMKLEIYFYPDAELVRILNNSDSIISNIHRRYLKQWVKDNNIKPEFKIGDKVIVSNPYKKHEQYEAEILETHKEVGRYTVYVSTQGHVKEGEGTRGWVVDYEDVSKK
jgi:hypothetical protein